MPRKQRYGQIEENNNYRLMRDRDHTGQLFYAVVPQRFGTGGVEIHSTIHKARKAMQEDTEQRFLRLFCASRNAR